MQGHLVFLFQFPWQRRQHGTTLLLWKQVSPLLVHTHTHQLSVSLSISHIHTAVALFCDDVTQDRGRWWKFQHVISSFLSWFVDSLFVSGACIIHARGLMYSAFPRQRKRPHKCARLCRLISQGFQIFLTLDVLWGSIFFVPLPLPWPRHANGPCEGNRSNRCVISHQSPAVRFHRGLNLRLDTPTIHCLFYSLFWDHIGREARGWGGRCSFQSVGFSQSYLWRAWVQSTARPCAELETDALFKKEKKIKKKDGLIEILCDWNKIATCSSNASGYLYLRSAGVIDILRRSARHRTNIDALAGHKSVSLDPGRPIFDKRHQLPPHFIQTATYTAENVG